MHVLSFSLNYALERPCGRAHSFRREFLAAERVPVLGLPAPRQGHRQPAFRVELLGARGGQILVVSTRVFYQFRRSCRLWRRRLCQFTMFLREHGPALGSSMRYRYCRELNSFVFVLR